ncbi:MAG: hypothetical protein A3K76_00630 [Euryarchaeota archaeon RBG_13_57_23]|nr:MAG: hypothetical protein A3K76_00630 [Euryarchaeota archaeon RBG_13_57_23]
MSSDEQQPNTSESPEPFDQVAKRPPRSYFLTLGADLTIAAGVATLANGTYAILTGTDVQVATDFGLTKEAVCGIIFVLFGIVSVAGGVAALKRMHFSLGLAGAALGMMGGGLIGFWLGLIALVMYALSHEDL